MDGAGEARAEAVHRVRVVGGWADVPTAGMGGEALVLPGIAALVHPDDSTDRILLQRRDKPGEEVRGRLEVPAGKWRAGETAWEAVRREVREETGLDPRPLGPPYRRFEDDPGRPIEVIGPLTAVVGVGSAYPVLLLVFSCVAAGDPRPMPGETTDPRWWNRSEVAAALASPERFTGPAAAIVRTWLG